VSRYLEFLDRIGEELGYGLTEGIRWSVRYGRLVRDNVVGTRETVMHGRCLSYGVELIHGERDGKPCLRELIVSARLC